MLVEAILGSLFYHKGTGAGKRYFGVSFQPISVQGLLTHQQTVTIPGALWAGQPDWDFLGQAATLGRGPTHQQASTSSRTPKPCILPRWDPALHQWVISHHVKKGLATKWARGQLCLPVHPQQSALPQQRGPCSPQKGTTRAYNSGDQMVVCC